MDALPKLVEIAVIGGGLAGLATAWALAERGASDVVVLEREPTLATHASGRNAAMCRALAEDDTWTTWTAAGAAFLRRPPEGFTDHPLVDDRGAVLLAGPAVARELADRAARFDVRCTPVSTVELMARWPGLAVARGGLLFPDDGCIDLARLVGGYVRGARRGGARIVTSAAVTAMAPRDGGVELTTGQGTVTARAVVVAAGAWAGEVGALAGAAVGFESRRRHIFSLAAPAPGAAAPIVWNVDGDEWYARPAGTEIWASACDNDVVAPGVVEPRREAEPIVRARLPSALGTARLVRAWACQRTFAPSGQPVVARDVDRSWLYWVAGLGGHGVTASAAIGRAAAAALQS